jgi:dolichol kinase
MGSSPANDAFEKVVAHVEFLVYASLIGLAALQADMITKYVLAGLLGFAASFIISLSQPQAAPLLLSIPLLFVAHYFSNVYYAVMTSAAAAITLHSSFKDRLNFAPWQLASGVLITTLGALGLSHPYFNSLVQSAPVQSILTHPYGRLAIGVGFGALLQWLTMQFFLRAAVGSFHNTEAVLVSQLIGAYMTNALGNIRSFSGSNAEAVVMIIAVAAWVGFWFYEFFNRLPQSTGVKLTLTSSIAVLLSTALFPVAVSAPASFISFFQKDVKYLLLGFWLTIFLSFSMIVALVQKHVSNTVVRKGFHFMALTMFLPAMIIDPVFLRAALCLAIAVFCFVEFVRYSQIFGAKISQWITKAMNAVTNDRDHCGPLTLSHVYLLIGCGFALIFTPASEVSKLGLDVMAGPLLVLAVGDSFSSIIGSKFGKHRWPSTNRTIEGTVAGIVTTIIAMFALCSYASINPNWMVIGIATTLTFLLEAYTKAIDNLVLPIFYFTAIKLLS